MLQAAVVTALGTGQPAVYVLFPGEKMTEFLIQQVNVQVTIYDAKNPRSVLYQGVIPCITDQFFSVQMDSKNRVKLVPSKFPNRTSSKSPRP